VLAGFGTGFTGAGAATLAGARDGAFACCFFLAFLAGFLAGLVLVAFFAHPTLRFLHKICAGVVAAAVMPASVTDVTTMIAIATGSRPLADGSIVWKRPIDDIVLPVLQHVMRGSHIFRA
jgi:hypothetical protein